MLTATFGPPPCCRTRQTARMAQPLRRIVKLSDDEDGDSMPMTGAELATLDLDGGNKLATGGRDSRPLRKKPAVVQRKPAAAAKRRRAPVQKKTETAEKAMTVAKVELESKEDTTVVDDSQLLPEQSKKRCKVTSVVSDAQHPPADIKVKYHLMKYSRHGKDGTYAVRLTGGPQFTEINMPNATLLQNREVAEAVCAELNKGVKPDTVRELMYVLKEAMCKKICQG